MADKVFKTLKQQLSILRSRGMNIKPGSQGSRAIRILERENYYSVINGYKEPFIASVNPETYLTTTDFDELYALFSFDRNIRSIYLKYILKAEHQIKAVLAHEFSKKYGHDNYMKLSNFDTSSKDKLAAVNKLFKKVQDEIAQNMNKSKEITHYMNQYGYVPLWVLTNVLTIGELSYFYSSLHQQDMNAISRFFGIQPFDLAKYLQTLTLARNFCAHDERFYDTHYRGALPVSRIKNFKLLNIPTSNGNCAYGTRDVYSVAIILTLILGKADAREFISSMDKEFKKLGKKLHTVSVNDIQRIMGFGTDWKNLTKLI